MRASGCLNKQPQRDSNAVPLFVQHGLVIPRTWICNAKMRRASPLYNASNAQPELIDELAAHRTCIPLGLTEQERAVVSAWSVQLRRLFKLDLEVLRSTMPTEPQVAFSRPSSPSHLPTGISDQSHAKLLLARSTYGIRIRMYPLHCFNTTLQACPLEKNLAFSATYLSPTCHHQLNAASEHCRNCHEVTGFALLIFEPAPTSVMKGLQHRQNCKLSESYAQRL